MNKQMLESFENMMKKRNLKFNEVVNESRTFTKYEYSVAIEDEDEDRKFFNTYKQAYAFAEKLAKNPKIRSKFDCNVCVYQTEDNWSSCRKVAEIEIEPLDESFVESLKEDLLPDDSDIASQVLNAIKNYGIEEFVSYYGYKEPRDEKEGAIEWFMDDMSQEGSLLIPRAFTKDFENATDDEAYNYFHTVIIDNNLVQEIDNLISKNKKSKSLSKSLKESIDKKYIMFNYNDPETLHFVKNIPESSDLWDDYNYIIKEVTNLKGKHLVTNDDESITISDSDIDDSDREAFEYAKEYFEANPTENKFIDDEWGGLVITRADIEKGLDNFTLISDFKIDNGYYDGDSSSSSQWIDFDKVTWEDYSNDSASDFIDDNTSSQEDFDIRGDKLFSYDGNAEIVIIPSSIKRIGEEAFYENKKIKKVFIPNSVVEIGDNAFKYCSKLKIYCETNSEPDDWSSYWNPHGRPVIWGAKVQDLKESFTDKSNPLKQLKESLGTTKYNKIQSLINECLKEGMEVEINIPKSKCKRLNESLTEEEKDELEIFLKSAEGNFPNKKIPLDYMRTQSKSNSSKVSILINQLGDNDLKVACKELGYRIV